MSRLHFEWARASRLPHLRLHTRQPPALRRVCALGRRDSSATSRSASACVPQSSACRSTRSNRLSTSRGEAATDPPSPNLLGLPRRLCTNAS
eukprot:6172706-Pleurochrysis_carterae.AAC.4